MPFDNIFSNTNHISKFKNKYTFKVFISGKIKFTLNVNIFPVFVLCSLRCWEKESRLSFHTSLNLFTSYHDCPADSFLAYLLLKKNRISVRFAKLRLAKRIDRLSLRSQVVITTILFFIRKLDWPGWRTSAVYLTV